MLKDLLFPKRCFSCQAWGYYLCHECAPGLLLVRHQRCIACQKPSLGGWTHPRCQSRHTPDRLISIFDYHDKAISRLVNTSKLALVPEIFSELSRIACLRIELRQRGWQKFVLCPIPQTRSRTKWRGFNQSRLIAQAFSNHMGLAIDSVLIKTRQTKQQKELNKQERAKNLTNCFRITCPEYIPQSIILIDDITTTGSTFLEAAGALKRTRVSDVWCLALAQD